MIFECCECDNIIQFPTDAFKTSNHVAFSCYKCGAQYDMIFQMTRGMDESYRKTVQEQKSNRRQYAPITLDNSKTPG